LILVIDTSVVVKWFVEEIEFEMARCLLDVDVERTAPELVIAETANVLQRKVRMGQMQESKAMEALRNLPSFFDRLYPSAELAGPGFALSRLLDHSIYDCMYLALTLRDKGARLVTSDLKFIGKANAAKLDNQIWNLNLAKNAVATGQENENG
jgi:predicted nucleic acid-binding protein